MSTTYPASSPGSDVRAGSMGRETNATQKNGGGRAGPAAMAEKLANGLGWFSIGLGLAEIVSPGSVARLIGVKNDRKSRMLLRGYGMREMTAGAGILARPRPTGWVWTRVAGDLVDLASLGSAMQKRGTNKTRAAAATAAVVGVTVLDLICGQQLAAEEKDSGGKEAAKVVRTIIVDRSPEEAYRFWHDFSNLPKFMTYLDSVRMLGERRSHWTAVGPRGMKVEWDAETTVDEPNKVIGWQSEEKATFTNSGTVRFDRAPGNRGTMVRVEMNFAPAGGMVPSVVSNILGVDIGQRIMHDLRNFKQVLELGEVTQSDSSIHPGMHPAQPSNEQKKRSE